MRALSPFAFVVIFSTALVTAAPGKTHAFLDKGKDLLKGMGVTSVPPSQGGASASGLTATDMIAGLKEALRLGSERVVGTLGRNDGFNKSADVHIPLPDTLKTAQSMLKKVGMGGLGADLELRLNRAAEAAVPKASRLFADAISQMTIDDAQGIVNGPKDSATQYFRKKMAAPLAADMKPIVNEQLSQVGAIKSYDSFIGQYSSLPFVPDAKADLTDHVLEKAIDGVFIYLAREEAAIRENPAMRTTELLKKVFGR